VDDDPHIRRVLGEGLAGGGHAVETVAAAEEALAAVERERFDVAFLDSA
jgi:CheY-like chemotaxis protein